MSSAKHDERRHLIANVVMDVISREGLEAATVRRIAAEVDCSTTVITHYFSDKRELLLFAYRAHSAYAREQFEAADVRDARSFADYLMTMAAYDDLRLAHWRAYIAIWDTSLRDSDFLTELRAWSTVSLDRVEYFINQLNSVCSNKREVARRLLAIIHGMSIQRLFDEQSWSEATMLNTLIQEIDLLVLKSD